MDPSSMAKSGRAAEHWDSKAVRERQGMFTWPGLEVREAKRAAWPTRPVKLSSASREVIFVSGAANDLLALIPFFLSDPPSQKRPRPLSAVRCSLEKPRPAT